MTRYKTMDCILDKIEKANNQDELEEIISPLVRGYNAYIRMDEYVNNFYFKFRWEEAIKEVFARDNSSSWTMVFIEMLDKIRQDLIDCRVENNELRKT